LINASIQNAFSQGDVRWHLEKLLLKASDYRVANSYAGLGSRGFSANDRHNRVIYNGFDFSRVERLGTAERPLHPVRDGNHKIVGMVAEFNHYKDYATFIRAAHTLSRIRQDVRFVAVGDGATLAASQTLAAGSDAIQFLGQRKSIEAVIDSFDIGVLSTFTEGISNSVMEYMAMRKPVVATDGGGTRELVVDGETGFLVPPENPAALATKIGDLLDDPVLARRMGEAGEAKLRREFSLTRMVDETVKLYQRALAIRREVAVGSDVRGGAS
jgi:glycosyltransferase involved in cell wall biosynthesis